MTLSDSVPQIDLSQGTPEELSQSFGSALEQYGFAVVTGHGISVSLIGRAYAASRTVFALPEAVKLGYERPETGHQIGYTPFGTEHSKDDPRPDLKEHWQLYRAGAPTANLFPDEVPEFSDAVQELYGELDILSVRLLSLLDMHLGNPFGYLPGLTKGGASLMRVLHYPPIVGTPDGMRSAAHEDINFLTLLVAATASGLELKTREGNWIPVTNPPNAIIVNCADMLQLLTQGRMPSMTHRVVNGDGGERFSMPFFVHPRGEVVLSPGWTAERYLKMRLREIGVLKDGGEETM